MILFCPRCGAQLGEVFKGQWFDTAVQCAECGLALAEPPLMLARGPADDEVEYALGAWLVPERAAATAGLAEVDIPYRWEPGLVLVVPAVAEAEVDQLLEDLGEADDEDDGDGDDDAPDGGSGGLVEDDDEDDDGLDGGAEAQEAMADLFVASDRLQHDPADVGLADDVIALAATVGASAPPYGIERPVWRRIQALASAVVAGVENGADDETVASDARALRDYLRDLV